MIRIDTNFLVLMTFVRRYAGACEAVCHSLGSHISCTAAYTLFVPQGVAKREEWRIYWTPNTIAATISRTEKQNVFYGKEP